MSEDVVLELARLEREAHRRVAERMAAAQVGEAFSGLTASAGETTAERQGAPSR